MTYPQAFETEWEQTARTGSKEKACDLWERIGRPAFGAAWKRWEACAEWQREGFPYPHVRTWLSDGRWRQDPGEARSHAAGGARAASSAAGRFGDGFARSDLPED